MKILYFHQFFTTPDGAAGTRSYEFSQALIRAGHEVHMVCGSFAAGSTGLEGEFVNACREGHVQGVKVTEFDLKYSNNDKFLSRSMKFLKYAYRSIVIALRSDCDLIFATSTPLTASIPGIVARWLKRKTFVFEVRDLWPELPKEMGVITNPIVLGLLSMLEWVSYKSAHACIGLSPGIVSGIKKRDKSKVVAMIPNGSDMDRFDLNDVVCEEIDGVSADDFVCMFTGAHGIANGLNGVLDVASILVANSEIKFVFIGSGMEKESLVARAQGENLTNCIFLSSVSKTMLPAYLKRADLALMILKNIPAFYYGTSPNKFFDYISAGKPIAINYPGWLANMVRDNALGIAVGPDNAHEFADAIVGISREKTMLDEMSANASRLASTEFARKELSKKFVSFLEAHQEINSRIDKDK